jgi:Zn-dependent peptidase ImmA (M78 family)/DNA-binding XRE family transcriptional regulator
MAFGERLRLARLRRGMSLAALAEKVTPKVSPQAINKYEQGEMLPSSSVLVGLAQALGVSLDFLMSNQVIALDGVEFRKRSGTLEKERALVEAEVIDRVERYLAIEDILGLPDEPSDLDEIEQVAIENLDGAEERATWLRKRWNLGGDPIPSMTALLEERNVRVIEIDGHDGFFGLTCHVKRPDNKPDVRVIVRRNVNVERNRFTLAHEVGHALIGECKEAKLEKAMDRFASAFLVPADHLRDEVGTDRTAFAYKELVRLKHLYGVSYIALLYRLKDVGVISEATLKNIFRTPARAFLKNEPEPLKADGEIAQLEKPQRFESHVYRALAEGYIASTKAAALLRRPLADVERAVKGKQ